MMMNAQHKAKASNKAPRDLRTFIAGGVQGVLVARRFVQAGEIDESTLESARGLSAPGMEAGITARAFAGADAVFTFMGEQKDKMSQGTPFARKLAAAFSNARLNGVDAEHASLIVWAIRLFMDAQKKTAESEPAPSRNVACNAARINELFAAARAHKMEDPRIRLKVGEQPVVFKYAPANSANPGCIYVSNGLPKSNGNVYFGKITTAG